MNGEYIVYGPKPLIPISNDSAGIHFYNYFKKYPDDIAFSNPSGDLVITYKDFLRNSCILAIQLKKFNLTEDDVIGICLGNQPEFLFLLMASLYLGITVTTLNPKYKFGELTHCVKISQPKIFFCTDEATKVVRKLEGVKKIVVVGANNVSNEFQTFQSLLSCDVSELELDQFCPLPVNVKEKEALILYSSGTTGLPKGVCLTHLNINAVLSSAKDPRHKDRYLGKTAIAILPMFHTSGLFITLLNLMNRKEVILMERFDPHVYLKVLREKKVEVIEGVPTIANFLLKEPSVKKQKLYVKCFTSGSGPLSFETMRNLTERFSLKAILQAYGITETCFRIACSSVDNNKLGSCGQLLPYMSLKVVDLDTGKTLGPLCKGEFYVKGPQIMKGYKNNRAATKEAIDKDGWFRSGDIGYYDSEGYIFVVDRIKNIIKYKEYQVSSAELELLLINHPSILEAAVIGVPDEDVGELPLAFVVKNPECSLTEVEVEEFVASQFISQKRLRGGVVFVKEIPKTAIGKCSKPQLRDLIKNKL